MSSKRMRKTSLSSNSFGGFLSPGAAPNYSDNKGWSSERVPHHPSSSSTACSTPTVNNNNGPRRHLGSSSALTTPFYSGRAIPSKWEDAERWICSPVAAGVCANTPPSASSQFSDQRRQKSKSGPIVPPPTLLPPHPHPPTYSPRLLTMRALEAAAAPRGLMVSGSPFSTGVLEADRVFRGSVGGGHGHSRSWIDLMSEESSSLCSKTDTEEKAEDRKETTAAQSPVVSRRDIATQMSPEEMSPSNNNDQSTPQELLLSPPGGGGGEVREVKMDKGAKMIKRPKRRVMSSRIIMRREQPEREEAKIAAWENLQKAKAEAAIRKLEVKLEKKKSASMDKILNKLQSAKLKAQEMRRSSITHLVRRHTTFMTPFMACFAPRVDCSRKSPSPAAL
ncbi:Remorin family protein [Raphanus sativus]|nr:Remorin family protein [Raphanus sativus]